MNENISKLIADIELDIERGIFHLWPNLEKRLMYIRDKLLKSKYINN